MPPTVGQGNYVNKRNQTSGNPGLSEELHTVSGGCHCGKVRFQVSFTINQPVQACNCSSCRMVGFIHLIVPNHQFELITGKEFLTEYRFNTKTAKHLFCKCCGVKSFYVPRSNPNGYSVNVRCLDNDISDLVKHERFDGQNWEANAGDLAHLT